MNKKKENRMIREQKKSGCAECKPALQPHGCVIKIHQVYQKTIDYPIPPARKHNKGKARAIKVLTFSRNAILITYFVCWLRLMGKSNFDPGYPVRSVLLNALLCICIGMLGLILHRIKTILMEEI